MTVLKSYLLLFIFLCLINISYGLEPGIFYKNREQKIEAMNEERASERKPTILHTMSSLGESYMDLVQFVSENVIRKIQNYLSLDYHLTKKQTEFQFENSGFNQYFYQRDGDSEEGQIKQEFKSKSEHRSKQFRLLSDELIQKESNKNKYNVREFNSFERLQQSPTVLTSQNEEGMNQNEKSQKSSIRLLQAPTVPDDGEIIRIGEGEKCENNSYLVLVEESIYFCNNNHIQESDYKQLTEEQIKENNCVVRKLKLESCLCPLDFTGRRCEFETRVYCDLTILNKHSCQEMNDFTYVSQYSGLPPCVQVNNEELINYHVNANCKNLLHISDKPKVYGVSTDFEILFDEKPLSAPSDWVPFKEFQYLIKTDKFVVSRPRRITPQLKYINWNILGESIVDNFLEKYTLSIEQQSGQKNFNIPVNFRFLNASMTTSGRYTIEFNLFEQFTYQTKDSFVLVASGTQLLVFEEEGYVEYFTTKVNKTLIIVAVVVSFVILFIIGYIAFTVYRKKNLKKRRNQRIQPMDENHLHQNLNDPSPNKELIEDEDDELNE